MTTLSEVREQRMALLTKVRKQTIPSTEDIRNAWKLGVSFKMLWMESGKGLYERNGSNWSLFVNEDQRLGFSAAAAEATYKRELAKMNGEEIPAV